MHNEQVAIIRSTVVESYWKKSEATKLFIKCCAYLYRANCNSFPKKYTFSGATAKVLAFPVGLLSKENVYNPSTRA
jgi:hypothetical protein